MGPDRNRVINYDAWFSDDDACRDWEISDHIPSRRRMSTFINAQFKLWRGRFSAIHIDSSILLHLRLYRSTNDALPELLNN
jgi:hypothetical protein